MSKLNEKEGAAIKRLNDVLADWPTSLTILSYGGPLHIRKGGLALIHEVAVVEPKTKGDNDGD